MSLFDLQPLTPDEIRERLHAGHQGETIMKYSSRGPGPGVWRTVRHRPWWEKLGKGPEGAQCKGCAFLRRMENVKTYFKCGKQEITSGPGTDIRAKDPACALFVMRSE